MVKTKLYIQELLFIFMVIFSFSFCCVLKVNAQEEYYISTCELSEDYVEWTKLSDEEKKNFIQPPMCDYSLTETNRLQRNILDSLDSFNRTKLPAKYDIRGTDRERVVKDQMNTGQCWAFSATTALEIFTKISLGEDWVYSPRHMEYATSRVFKDGKINEWGFNRDVGSGGHVFFSSGYLMSQVGPVLESDMPFENNENIIDISEIEKEPVLDVNDLTINGLNKYAPCDSTVISDMKNKIVEKGALVSSMYFTSSSSYLNDLTGAFYYNGIEHSNHSITIVGWDDNYAVTNFSSSNRPSSPGAWIIQNSWGTSVGDNGYNYISYLDERICTIYMSIDDIDTEFEDNSYIYDKLGHNVSLGYTATATGEKLKSGHGMAVYKKGNQSEILKEVTMGTAGIGKYKIYYADGDASKKNISNMRLIGEGTTNGYGYLTHKFDNPLIISKDVTKFSIAVYWELTNNFSPIPVTAISEEDYIFLESNTGQTFISCMGDYWQDAASEQYIVSIKAFTNNVNYDLKANVSSVDKVNNSDINVSLALVATNVEKEKINMVVKDKNNNNIDGVDVTYELDTNNELVGANLRFSNKLSNGTYYINVYYDSTFVTTLKFDLAFGLHSDVYRIDTTEKMIYVYDPVEINIFLSNLTGYNGDVLKNGSRVSSGYIGTGMTIDGYSIVINGDVDGDGLISPVDYVKIKNHIMGTSTVSGKVYISAADYDDNEEIEPLDYVKVKNYIMKG